MIPYCNIKAYEENRRYIEKNLNRSFLQNGSWNLYEENIAKEIMPYIETCDYLLDIHSTSASSVPFFFSEIQHREVVETLWIGHIIYGWGSLGSDILSGDTESYANSHGKVWLTFESGSHLDDSGKINAYQIIKNLLSKLQMIDKSCFSQISSWNNFVKIQWVEVSRNGKWQKNESVNNFSYREKDEIVWTDGDLDIRMQESGFILLPKGYAVQNWEEIFMYGEKI